ncbi:MAG: RNA 2',3'-cyclic phosphodiesterase [Pseudomonadota bacterium]
MSTGETDGLARLFFALWPNDEIRRSLAETRKCLDDIRANWIRPDKLHITLAFLGQIDAERIIDISGDMDDIHCHGFELILDRVEIWRRTQVLCITPSTPGEGVFNLVEMLIETLRRNGFKPDARPYRPHLTLARRVKTRPPVREAEITPVRWSAGAFCLIESRQAWGDSQYLIHKTWPLKP